MEAGQDRQPFVIEVGGLLRTEVSLLHMLMQEFGVIFGQKHFYVLSELLRCFNQWESYVKARIKANLTYWKKYMLRGIVILWTIFCGYGLFAGVGGLDTAGMSDAEAAGAGLGVIAIFIIWGIVVVPVSLLGLIFKKS